MASQPTPIASLDDDVATLLDLNDKIEQLEGQRATIKARLAQHAIGTHETTFGVKVVVSAPARKFNQDKAWMMLNEEQREVCFSPDAKKIKSQLAPVLLDECMEPGTGSPVVKVV